MAWRVVIAGLAVLLVAACDENSPPTRSQVPRPRLVQPSPTVIASSEEKDCGRPVSFVPGRVPEGWSGKLQNGSGGGGVPFPGLLGHYGIEGKAGTAAGAQGGFIEVVAEQVTFLQTRKSTHRILGRRATIGRIHEGFSAEFTHRGCDYTFLAYGMPRPELADFATGLERRS